MKYFVYVIKSKKDGSFYTGISSDVDRRLIEHNRSDTKSTRSKIPWILVYVEACESRIIARQREKYWKSGAGRDKRSELNF